MRFTESEVREIMKRAAARSEGALTAQGGLSLEELYDAAKGVGISRRDIEQAIADLDAHQSGPLDLFFGAPRRVELERTVPVEASDQALLGLRAEIEHATNVPGRSVLTPSGLTWHSYFMPGAPRVAVSRGDGRSTIRVEARYHGLAGALFGGVGAGGAGAFGGPLFGILLFTTHSWATALGAAMAATAVAFGLARWIFRDVVRKRRRRLERLFRGLLEKLDAPKPRMSSGELPSL